MNKSEYYDISDSLKITKRCPILESCERRAWSIYLLGYYDVSNPHKLHPIDFLISEGELKETFKEEQISIQGEKPGLISGGSNFYFHDVCPEVNLFDNNNAIFFARKKASSSASWDDYKNEPKAKIIECRHYSECPEYSKHISNIRNENQVKNRPNHKLCQKKKKQLSLLVIVIWIRNGSPE